MVLSKNREGVIGIELCGNIDIMVRNYPVLSEMMRLVDSLDCLRVSFFRPDMKEKLPFGKDITTKERKNGTF